MGDCGVGVGIGEADRVEPKPGGLVSSPRMDSLVDIEYRYTTNSKTSVVQAGEKEEGHKEISNYHLKISLFSLTALAPRYPKDSLGEPQRVVLAR